MAARTELNLSCITTAIRRKDIVLHQHALHPQESPAIWVLALHHRCLSERLQTPCHRPLLGKQSRQSQCINHNCKKTRSLSCWTLSRTIRGLKASK